MVRPKGGSITVNPCNSRCRRLDGGTCRTGFQEEFVTPTHHFGSDECLREVSEQQNGTTYDEDQVGDQQLLVTWSQGGSQIGMIICDTEPVVGRGDDQDPRMRGGIHPCWWKNSKSLRGGGPWFSETRKRPWDEHRTSGFTEQTSL